MISRWRIALLILLTVAMALLWNYPFLLPFKVFVVYLHEISHGLGSLVTGGTVKSIAVSWNESGVTHTVGGNFLATASAGYMGSVIFGSVMLNASLKDRFTAFISVLLGVLLLFFTLFYLQQDVLIFAVSVTWGLVFLITALVYRTLNRILLFFLGGLTSAYSFYDLGDFFRGEVLATDAGIIAHHYLPNSSLKLPLAYFIALVISAISVWLLYRIIVHALHVHPEPEEQPPLEDGADLPPGMLTPEMMALIDQINREKNGSR